MLISCNAAFTHISVRVTTGVPVVTYHHFFFFSSRRRHTRCGRDWSSDVCSSDLRNDDYGIVASATVLLPAALSNTGGRMPDSSNNETIRFLYTFEFPDSTEKEFEVELNAKTLELATKKDLPKPAWTKLKYKQCEQCPLGDEHEYCPVAVNLSALVESFKDSVP